MKKCIIILLFLLPICACSKKVETRPGQLKPGSPEYIMNQGLYFLNEGNLHMAESKLQQALKKKPNMEGALNGMGLVHLYRREFDKAASCFRRVILVNPQFADAHNSLGLIFTEQGKYDAAKEHLLIAANTRRYKTPENAFVNLATLELKYNNLSSARRYIQKALDANQRFSPVWNVMGIIAEREEDYAQALRYYKKAQALLTHDDINLLINMGRVYGKLGEKNKALDTLEKALTLAQTEALKNHIRQLIKEISG